ncbi:receptor like protein 27-like [Bidens hawaiensis]|uniref:receptor like protein 27-like n=1 Tax=Bidens hawaiensis TaxID=980011 RepID=UPI00404B3486
MLIQNLTELRHLYLDNVNIVTHDWSGFISSLLPNLQVLSLKSCNLSGSLEDSSLAKLKHLSVIILDGNTFSSGIPESFADLQNITVLSLQGCNLSGLLPYKIFQVPTINTIDLSMNVVLEGPLPDSMGAVELQNLILSGTRVGGKLPDSIGSLKALSRVELRGCEFNGPIPESMQNLTRLQVLDLSFNQLTGSTPSFQSSKNHLVWVGLNQNKLTGGIPSFEWEGLDKLEYLDLANNSLTGSFPDAFLTLKSLEHLDLSYNSFSGKTNDDSINASFFSYQLRTIDLSSNKFEGPLPGFIFKLAAISSLELSANKFTGRVNLHMFANLKELSVLDLSYNNLTVSVEANNSFSSLSKLNKLKLASCKMQQIPDLKNLSGLAMLDLSDNQLSGEIPSWIWETGNGFLRQLNLSYNKFSSLQKPYTFPFLLDVLDLHFNNLEGDIPIPPTRVYVLDYSNNKFGSSIPVDFGNALTSTFFFSVSNNKLVGPIPQSICNASSLAVLDLSSNSLNGTLPSCLAENTKTLRVLNLRGNNLTGNVVDAFPESCDLQTLDLSANHFQGPLPQSLVNCKNLMVLDLGHNIITDTFPCWLNNLSSLHVFVIRSNRFHGNITCLGSNSLQIMDIASNRFSGVLPPTLFTSFQGIINNTRSKPDYLYFQHPAIDVIYYQDSTSVVLKGTERKLEKILNIFTSIDFSNNRFNGSISVTLGDLKLVKLVNFSHNALTGPLLMSVGKLINLESLDLSVNKLSGSIPLQLASLSFLSFLNLSYNELSGRIPRGSQFQTFTRLSFKGNQGLCGMPLNKSCSNMNNATSELPTETNEDESDLYVSIGLGFVVGFVMIIGPLVFLRRWRIWYNNHVDGLLSRIMKSKDEGP